MRRRRHRKNQVRVRDPARIRRPRPNDVRDGHVRIPGSVDVIVPVLIPVIIGATDHVRVLVVTTELGVLIIGQCHVVTIRVEDIVQWERNVDLSIFIAMASTMRHRVRSFGILLRYRLVTEIAMIVLVLVHAHAHVLRLVLVTDTATGTEMGIEMANKKMIDSERETKKWPMARTKRMKMAT